ncbi:MAG TPA: VOC family protein [Candidatus Sulfotelmatobacter sp.]|nr:VOC family protein [Candidatus Sulfotelmatobacter sp.]
MPKIRHIALATQDPEKTAEFYKTMFGFREVGRAGSPENTKAIAWGIYLSDGTLNLAVLKFQNIDQLGRGLDYVGIHHFGILVDDLEHYRQKLAEAGAPCIMEQKSAPSTQGANYETKFRGPDGVVFDLSEHAWAGAAPLAREVSEAAE